MVVGNTEGKPDACVKKMSRGPDPSPNIIHV